MAAVYLARGVEDAVNDAGRLADEVQPPAGVEMWITGIPQVYHEFNAKIEMDLFQAEAISLPIALLILLAVGFAGGEGPANRRILNSVFRLAPHHCE